MTNGRSRTKEAVTGGAVILIGFMGTGKSTVGRILAERLGAEFVDTDQVIEREQGMGIPDLFRERGEAAFRAIETETLKRLLDGSRRVIATGGGAVLAAENREAMRAGGTVVALKASPETIIRRVAGGEGRPLLAGDAAANVRRLLELRKTAYDFADFTVVTDGLTADEVARRILHFLAKESR